MGENQGRDTCSFSGSHSFLSPLRSCLTWREEATQPLLTRPWASAHLLQDIWRATPSWVFKGPEEGILLEHDMFDFFFFGSHPKCLMRFISSHVFHKLSELFFYGVDHVLGLHGVAVHHHPLFLCKLVLFHACSVNSIVEFHIINVILGFWVGLYVSAFICSVIAHIPGNSHSDAYIWPQGNSTLHVLVCIVPVCVHVCMCMCKPLFWGTEISIDWQNIVRQRWWVVVFSLSVPKLQ